MPTSPFALKYQLDQGLRPYNREEVLKLEQNRMGLYVIWVPAEAGGSYEYMYAGMSRTCLRRRLRQHLNKGEPNAKLRNEIELFRDVVRFSVAYTETKEETRPLEKHIISDWKPFTNRQGLAPIHRKDEYGGGLKR